MSSKILMYHSVGDNKAFFTTSLQNFEWQMEYLKKNNFEVVSLQKVLTSSVFANPLTTPSPSFERRGKVQVAITFDDGYLDNYQNVFPIIKKYNFPISIFLPTSLLGNKFTNSQGQTLDIMSDREIKEMTDSGLVTFYPHGHSHKTSFELNDAEFEEDVNRSQEVLVGLLGKKNIFCYPKGKIRQETKEILKKLGVDFALGVNMGDVENSKDKYEINRIAIDSVVSKIKFKIYLSKYFNFYLSLKKIIKKYANI